eukprot:1156437-Pelagomonas_calceolata.AAC.18
MALQEGPHALGVHKQDADVCAHFHLVDLEGAAGQVNRRQLPYNRWPTRGRMQWRPVDPLYEKKKRTYYKG